MAIRRRKRTVDRVIEECFWSGFWDGLNARTTGGLEYASTSGVGHFTDEPTHCSICLEDLTGVYDTTGELSEADPISQTRVDSTGQNRAASQSSSHGSEEGQ